MHDTDACCHLRKTVPLQKALGEFDAWITGRKRYQGATRSEIDFFENEADQRIKVNPLAHWTSGDLRDYIDENRLPRHPLGGQGLSLHRLRALHHPRQRWRGSARRTLARQRKGGMRHPLRQRQTGARRQRGGVKGQKR